MFILQYKNSIYPVFSSLNVERNTNQSQRRARDLMRTAARVLIVRYFVV